MPTVTLAQLQERIYSRLDNNTLLYEQVEVTARINECMRTLNLFTGILQVTLQTPTLSQPGRVWYDVPQGIIVPIRVQFSDTYLNKIFPTSMGMSNARWVSDTTANTGLPVSEWVPCGFTKFALHPADSIGGSEIFVTGIMETPLLINQTDTVAIPNEFTDALVLSASATLMLKETSKLKEQGNAVLSDYYKILKKIQIWRNWLQPRFWIAELTEKK
jgi:hypothetical protein